ncbi:MAG: phosphate--nucleotide phosphotransferase [Sandaracinus sp.]|nr:phosphate--nucleotide phosphotransferase [Sandaracinus sp.]|tara:strand:+ start:3406 stop:4323 length:918 start_codon:yes stop_codon:yes gene_type:complete
MGKNKKKRSKDEGFLCELPKSEYLVPFDGTFRIGKADTAPPDDAPQGKKGKKENKEHLLEHIEVCSELQRKFYAHDRFSLLLVFQAMDAAGKDGTIRAVMTGLNPAGVQTFTFKRPSAEELEHDFLWRVHQRVPERGRIGIFNRSHYEEVLIVRVAKLLASRRLPRIPKDVWDERLESIRDFEKHLARNGTLILKFFLNVSRDEQEKRLRARLDDPAKNWKFEAADLDVREQWDEYMEAYEAALNATSTPWAPWYAIPADDKPFMRRKVASILRQALENLPLEWPQLHADEIARLDEWRGRLESD